MEVDRATATLDLDVLTIRVGGDERPLFVRRNTSDTMLVGQIFVDRSIELGNFHRLPELSEWLISCRQLGKRPLVVDAGANIGLTALSLCYQIADARIVAIEPEQMNFQLLVANTEGLPVIPVPAALSSKNDPLQIFDPGAGEWGYRTTTTEDGGIGNTSSLVPCVTINEILEAHGDDCLPFVVKIDIEGAESDVFSANTEWVDEVPLIIVELHDWMIPGGRTSHPVLKRLLQSDRDFVIFGENIFSMPVRLTMAGADRKAVKA